MIGLVKVGFWISATFWLVFSYLALDVIWHSATGCLFEGLIGVPNPQLIIFACVPLLLQTLFTQVLTLLSNSTNQSYSILKTLPKISQKCLQLTLIFFCSITTASELKILSIPQISSCTLAFLLTISLYTLGSIIDHHTKTAYFSFPGKSSNILNTFLILSLLFRDFYYNFKQTTQ